MSDDPYLHQQKRRFFLCTGEVVKKHELPSRSHIIGELRYVEDEGHRVTALAVYDVSVPAGQCPPQRPSIRLDVIGDARNIRCTICGNVQRWEIGQAGFLALMSHFGITSMEQVNAIVQQKAIRGVKTVV